MNVLFLVHRTPHPPNRGDRIRSYQILRELTSRRHVHLAALADEAPTEETLTFLHSVCRAVEIAPIGGATRWARGARSMACGRTATEGLFRSPQLAKTLRKWATQTRFDAVFVYCSSMLQYADMPEFSGLPAIIDLVDVDSQKWFDYAQLAPRPKRWLFELEGRRLRNLERAATIRAATVSLVSEPEARLLRNFAPNDRTMAVPNGVDLEYFRPEPHGPDAWSPLGPNESADLVFVGALDYRANVDGLLWFASNVWPKIRLRLPHITLNVVGRNPVRAIQKLARLEGIRVVGGVPDVRPYLAGAKIAIAPLRVARGIQNKVLEAMAMGVPVVATPAAVEGLDCLAARDVVTADEPEAWTQELDRLLADEKRRASIADHGRRFVQTHHCWTSNLAALMEKLELAASPAAAAASERKRASRAEAIA